MNKLVKNENEDQKPVSFGNSFTCAGLFSGIGGFCEGFEKAGFNTVWLNEINPASNKVYLANRPNANIFECDVKELSVKTNKISPVDVLHAGFPCQSFSGAGARKGFADDRGKLFYEIIRIVREFEKTPPKILVLENTPNIMKGAGGAWITEIISQIQSLGYWVGLENCVLIDTRRNFGLPQRRERVFIFAVHKLFYDGNPFSKFELSLPIANIEPIENFISTNQKQDGSHYLGKKNRFGQMISDSLEKRPPFSLAQLRKTYVRDIKEGECPTLTANMGKGGHNVPFLLDDFGLRRLTVTECANLQGFPRTFKMKELDVSRTKLYEMIGNSVSPVVSEFIAIKVSNFLGEKNGL